MPAPQPFEIFNLTITDMFIIILMIAVFLLALLLPYPDKAKRGKQ